MSSQALFPYHYDGTALPAAALLAWQQSLVGWCCHWGAVAHVLSGSAPWPCLHLRVHIQILVSSQHIDRCLLSCVHCVWGGVPQAYELRGAGAVLHSHSLHAVMATMLDPQATEFKVTHLEMIKVRVLLVTSGH